MEYYVWGDNLFDAILGDDRALDITVSEHNGVPFMAGRFGSSNMPALSGLQSVNGQYTGSYDGFIQAFKVNAEPKWLTIIGGQNKNELIQ
ncbi:MAG: hypothetical protein M0D57_02895 [Sphingobacteriales bacterium JAD_PAG50586_3]|nr:MAG: hypothetical protein M0D57_02895 [Sphingobacteriales bacterium JAD_PAG50586_3]